VDETPPLIFKTRANIMNLIRSLALSALLAVAAYAGTAYKVELAAPAKVGAVELKAGQYSVAVDGGKITFTKDRAMVVEAPVTVETATQKFKETMVETSGGSVKAISFRDTTMKVVLKAN
jgi:hypothetical protein